MVEIAKMHNLSRSRVQQILTTSPEYAPYYEISAVIKEKTRAKKEKWEKFLVNTKSYRQRQEGKQKIWAYITEDSNNCWQYWNYNEASNYEECDSANPRFACRQLAIELDLRPDCQYLRHYIWVMCGKEPLDNGFLANRCGNSWCVNPDHFQLVKGYLFPFEAKLDQYAKRAKYHSGKHELSPADLFFLADVMPACCQCGATDDLSFDHVASLYGWGSNAAGNIQVLCRRHNTSKGRWRNTDYRTAEQKQTIWQYICAKENRV